MLYRTAEALGQCLLGTLLHNAKLLGMPVEAHCIRTRAGAHIVGVIGVVCALPSRIRTVVGDRSVQEVL